ncbi:hypothetical protein [Acidiphilium angustum]|uniref:Uncharacterized protein n=2 Tax=Acidiphilium rubrum TaxID=526 RepID=A0A8G2FBX0_ACIRU|nr:hypothetical protein [Acidiphilium angustum]SIQ09686.1 hypothetical protein SAMN05421828_101257 [Acidiphilium rubrum]
MPAVWQRATMKDPIGFLASRAGRYSGPGVAHDTRAFTGVLIIDPPLNPANLSYRFTATATDGELLHTEIACLGRNQGDEIEIVHISNNIPGLQHFQLAQSADHDLVLHHGNLADPQSFREIVHLAFSSETTARLSYDWARPGEAIVPQSWVELVKDSP